MASLSSISIREIREPAFTFDQEKAMQCFFNGSKVSQIRSTERRKEFVGGLAVLTAIVATGLFLTNSK